MFQTVVGVNEAECWRRTVVLISFSVLSSHAGSPRHYPSRYLLGVLDKIVTPAQQEGIHSSTALRRQAGHLRDYEMLSRPHHNVENSKQRI